MTTRAEVVAYAAGLAGLSADPADELTRAVYLDTIAPGETPQMRHDMALMSGCELTALAVLRRFAAHPLLDGRYVVGKAGVWLWRLARDADAFSAPGSDPCPGDIVIVGGGVDGGGPEHAWICKTAKRVGYVDAVHVEAIDGGQRDDGGHQSIAERDHRIEDGHDVTDTYRRTVRWVIDTMAVVSKWPRQNENS